LCVLRPWLAARCQARTVSGLTMASAERSVLATFCPPTWKIPVSGFKLKASKRSLLKRKEKPARQHTISDGVSTDKESPPALRLIYSPRISAFYSETEHCVSCSPHSAQTASVGAQLRHFFGTKIKQRPTMTYVHYPTIAEVIAADQEQVSLWWNFLPDPKTPLEERVMELIFKKFYVTGGFAPDLVKRRAAGK